MAIISGNFRTGNSGSPGTPDGGAYTEDVEEVKKEMSKYCIE
jgi:hypothetical protein